MTFGPVPSPRRTITVFGLLFHGPDHVKKKYDPANLFRYAPSIPASA